MVQGKPHGFHIWALGLLVAILALQPRLSLGQANSTLPADIAALIDLVTSISSVEGTLLGSWDVSTDPCTSDGWPGVICKCSDLPSPAGLGCSNAVDPSGSLRVKGLDLHHLSSSMQKLQGSIPAAVGGLGQLVFLDLSNNQLSGAVPDQLANLQQLQWLLLNDNQLNNTLPAYLGQMVKLQTVQLNNNGFSGPVPSSWCSGNATYDVSGNSLLCGVLPRCFLTNSRVLSTAGTYLSSTALTLGSTGGACDATPPGCDADVGCVIWTPKYWTNISFVQFNFTGFVDYESSIMRYQWGLGTAPFANDVMPLTQVTGNKFVKDIRFSGSSKHMFVTVVYFTLPSFSLVNGLPYYVTVVAYNGAGPPLTSDSTSAPVIVDQTGPVPSMVYNTFEFRQDVTTKVMNYLQASWDDWADPESGIAGYYVQFYQVLNSGANRTRQVKNVTDVIYVGLVNLAQMKTSMLKDGMVYYANVTATNNAGLNTSVLTIPITVERAPLYAVPPGTAAAIAIISGLGCLVVGAGAQYVMMNIKMATETQREKERQQEQKQLKQLMYALSAHTDSLGGQGTGMNGSMTAATRAVDIHAKELAFVFTDIENSTEISNQDPAAFKQIQEAHDQIMREGIAKHRGYEIITEGDSFQVAFATCQAAIQFCLDVQYRLLEQSWSKEILKLHACRVVRVTGDYNQVVFAGPRVRMGVHYAHPGTVAMRTHNITRQNVYGGPAIKIGSEVSDIAAGGQILLTEEAVMKLAENMSQAGFPVIKLCGQYKLDSTSTPAFLYSCNEQVGKPLKRTFGDLRKARKMWPHAEQLVPAVLEYNIHVPPVPEGKSNALSFVCLRLTTYPKNGCNIPEHLQRRFLEVFAVQVQQFKGYMFQTCPDSLREGIWTAVFSSCMDALRFAHAAQLLLMHTQWPTDARPFCGEALPGADGRWVFQGPRVCMAIHDSADYFVSEDSSTGARTSMIFAGPAVTLPLILTYAGRGGQVILSETAWEAVKGTVVHHPGAVRIISLGTHVVSDDFPHPMLLMEVMPNLLSKRVFQSVLTKQMLEPGYRDAPDPKDPMAIVFVKVNKPKEVEEAEKGTSTLPDDAVKLLVQENQVALGVMGATVRKLLKLYRGYECKEPEPGKFTLAFQNLEDAICWGCHFQEELLFVSWPATLLEQCTECRLQTDPITGLPIWRGLRVKVGMSYGMVNSKKPLNTGRADYYGVLANGAARVMALAAPGQVLVEAMAPPSYTNPITQKQELLLRPDDVSTLALKRHVSCSLALSCVSPQQDAALKAMTLEGEQSVSADGWRCYIQADGFYVLRGLSNARLIYKAYSARLGDRGVNIPQERLAPPPMAMNHSFASSRESMKFLGSWVNSFRTKHMAGRGSATESGSDSRNMRIAAASCLGSARNSPTADAGGFIISADAGSPRDANSEPSGLVSSCISSSRLSAQMPRARSQEFGPGCRSGGAAGLAAQDSGDSFVDMPEALSSHSRRARSWVAPVLQHSSHSSQQAQSFTMQDPGLTAARSSSSGLLAQATAGHYRQQLQHQHLVADGTIRHASAPGCMGDLYMIPARLAPIHTRVSSPGLAGDTSDASGGSSLASTPTPADSSYSQGPVEVSNPLQQQQQLYLQAQAQRVVQQHSVATQGNTTAQQFHHAAPGDVASQSVGSSLELTAGLNLDQLRSHSQLLLMQQQSQHNMQLMVHKKESGELSANSSWDGMGGLKGFMTNLAGPVERRRSFGRFGLSLLLNRLPGRNQTLGGSYEGEDLQAAAARQQHGMALHTNMPRTPGSAGSYGSYAHGTALTSPGTAYAMELGEAYVNHRHNSATAGQMYPSLYEARAASYNAGSAACASPQVFANTGLPAADGRQANMVFSAASYSPHHFQRPHSFGAAWHQPGSSQLQSTSCNVHQASAVTAALVTSAAVCAAHAAEDCAAHTAAEYYEGTAADGAADPAAVDLEWSLCGGVAAPQAPPVAVGIAAPAVLSHESSPGASPEPAVRGADATTALLLDSMWRSHDEHMLRQANQQQQMQLQQPPQGCQDHRQDPSEDQGCTRQAGPPAEMQQFTPQHLPAPGQVAVPHECNVLLNSNPTMMYSAPITAVATTDGPAALAVRTAAASGVPFSVPADEVSTGGERLVLRLADQEQPAAGAVDSRSASSIAAPQKMGSNAVSTLQEQLEQARQSGTMILTSHEYGTYVRQQQQQRVQEQRYTGVTEGLQSGFQGTATSEIEALVQQLQEHQQQQALLQVEIARQAAMQPPSGCELQAFNDLQQQLRVQQQQMTPQQLQQALQQMDQQPLPAEPRKLSQTSMRSPLGLANSYGGAYVNPDLQGPQNPDAGMGVIGLSRGASRSGVPASPGRQSAAGTAGIAAQELQPETLLAARAAAAAGAGTLLQQVSLQQQHSQYATAAGSTVSSPRSARTDNSYASAGVHGVGFSGLSFGSQSGLNSPRSTVGTPRSGAGTPRSVHSRSSMPGTRGGSMVSIAPGELRSRSLAVLGSSPSPVSTPRYPDSMQQQFPAPADRASSPVGAYGPVQAAQQAVGVAWQQAGSGTWPCSSELSDSCLEGDEDDDLNDEHCAAVYVGPPDMLPSQMQQSGGLANSSPPAAGGRCRTPSVMLDFIPEAQGQEDRQSDAAEEHPGQ